MREDIDKNYFVIHPATKEDLNCIVDLLKSVNLPTEDVELHIHNFLRLDYQGQIIGTIGLEIYTSIGLLRSMAVSTPHQKEGIGQLLFNALLEKARRANITDLYLFTITAKKYFEAKGFVSLDCASLPSEIQNTYEFKHACCASAVCMRLRLE